MKKLLLYALAFVASLTSEAQTLDKMQWFNEPSRWEIKSGTLTMDVTPQTDY